MMKFALIGILFFAAASPEYTTAGDEALHPLHISVTDIEYDPVEEELEIMIRVFTDDLEKAIRQQRNDATLDLIKPASGTTDALAKEYLDHHLAITIDNIKTSVEYLGHENEGDALIFYVLVSNVKKWKTIEVRNDLLMELFDDQSNLVHVTVAGKVRSMRLVNSSPSGTLTF